ncbi:TPA: IS5 family transposase [Methanosarcina acetivorans]|uniref:Transposase n=2 Tax=Methanosarcina acetivorans TaxID=2214 RepID=Q8TIT0_METAC|nr:IS5 family transposase [Methanosarcina acetivorans]AAM07410.1 transposase [Methanosarcina acetivorans C2A]HIH94696.1 IS5 family transposase [Methanosarcina acetivorans]
MTERKTGHDYEISYELWTKIKALLPLPKPKKKAGRPREDDRKIMNGIFYLLRTGCQWKALPRFYGVPGTVHDRFQEWQRSGLFEKIWQLGLMDYDDEEGLEWEWQAIDGAMTKAPLGGAGTGANPTDRGKIGTKRSLLTDGKGIPLSVVVDGANRHDKMLVKGTIDAIIIERPSHKVTQNIRMDKGYDFPDIRQLVDDYGYTAHIRKRGEENIRIDIPGYRARRWVVERTHSWLNRFRRMLIKWEKKIENYLAMLHLACAWITFRAAGLFE